MMLNHIITFLAISASFTDQIKNHLLKKSLPQSHNQALFMPVLLPSYFWEQNNQQSKTRSEHKLPEGDICPPLD